MRVVIVFIVGGFMYMFTILHKPYYSLLITHYTTKNELQEIEYQLTDARL